MTGDRAVSVALPVATILSVSLSLANHSTAAVNGPVDQTSPEATDAEQSRRLVFGSFAEAENAHRYAERISRLLALPIGVSATDAARYRVVGPPSQHDELESWMGRAQALGLQPWRLQASRAVAAPAASAIGITITAKPDTAEELMAEGVDRTAESRFSSDLDLGVQNRLFANRGSNEADRAQFSVSAQYSWSREFNAGQDLLAFEAFGRWDSDDDRRTHADLRELSITHIADRWQLQAGVGQVFWGVVEFNHLIDVVNQTDLIENPDTEDKLGQPMVAFTALPDWGSVEVYVLPGFRERTLPGLSGRLSTALPIRRDEVSYESGAGDKRVDGLVRLSTQLGAVLFDVYHFNGTRRTPRFEVGPEINPEINPVSDSSELTLVQNYDTVKQTAVALQTNAGDTAFKLEALQQDGGPESYWAGALGVEHTFVGVFGGATDLGAVVEYHYDSRGGTAFDSFFENDLAIGARLGANDIYDSQALFGVVWDTSSQERVVILEASRRLGDRWNLALESRWFSGGSPLGRNASVADLLNPDNKLGSVQRDDYLQFEFTRFF